MEKSVERTERSRPSGGPGSDLPSGQSGEGARSALEQLLQQEKQHAARRPREAGGPPAGGPAP